MKIMCVHRSGLGRGMISSNWPKLLEGLLVEVKGGARLTDAEVAIACAENELDQQQGILFGLLEV